jgi:hypothetical protein
MMISTFLDESYANPQNSIVIQNQFSFMSDDSDANFNETLRKINCSGSSRSIWNHYLSWYVQQKSSRSPLFKKAIYKRNSESLSNIVNLANLAVEEGIRKWQLNFKFC